MVGRKVLLQLDKAPPQPRRGACSRPSISAWSTRAACAVLDDVGFELRAGEIVGIAGVSGNGQTELLRGAGRHPARRASGTLTVRGRKIDAGASGDPRRDARPRPGPRAGGPPAPGPGRRRSRPSRPRSWAITSEPTFSRGSCSTRPRSAHHCAELMERFDVRPRRSAPAHRRTSPAATSRSSCWRARWRARPKVLLVGQPTRGVDIGAIEFIHAQLVAMRDAGMAVLLVSVELDEILALADRILVMFAGRIVGEVAGRRPTSARSA